MVAKRSTGSFVEVTTEQHMRRALVSSSGEMAFEVNYVRTNRRKHTRYGPSVDRSESRQNFAVARRRERFAIADLCVVGRRLSPGHRYLDVVIGRCVFFPTSFRLVKRSWRKLGQRLLIPENDDRQ